MNAIRLATAQDLPALKALVEKAYRGDSARGGWTHEADLLNDERISMEDLAGVLANPAMRVLVMPGDGAELVATVSITNLGATSSRDEGVAYLGMLGVDPQQQAGGVGRKMITAAEALAADAFGAHTMRMTVISRRSELIAYYVRRGYVDTGKTSPFPYPSGAHLSMVVLEKPIMRQG